MNNVYINKMSRFLPNDAISVDEMEDYLGYIKKTKSRAKPLILRNNGIKTRYYALDKEGNYTHTNAALVHEAIKLIEKDGFSLDTLELLAVGTTSPDQLLPAHASMVQGLLKNRPMEVISPEGSCNSGMLALKYAHMSVMTASAKNAIAGGSELLSSWLRSSNYEDEAELLLKMDKEPYIQFEREFLRWMLSDGASVALLENKPNENGLSYRIDFIDILSYSNELPSCMYAGGERTEDGQIRPWRTYTQEELTEKSILSIRQDTRLLAGNIVETGARGIKRVCEKYNFTTDEIDYFLPHMSSEYFRFKIEKEAEKAGCPLPQEKWFTNLHKFGNVGAASAFLMMEELFNSGKLKKGDKILVMSPESARFSYAYIKMTVV
ncbi:MAG: beta-ketoacyl-ACP synthase III [Bacteroidales bacterium]|nr:beta-ketoacyl-ACP synthase III [Bacteroidales bacterium]